MVRYNDSFVLKQKHKEERHDFRSTLAGLVGETPMPIQRTCFRCYGTNQISIELIKKTS